MRTLYQLDGCSTCRRIRNELGEHSGLEIVDIKTNPLTPDHLATLAGTHESLFSRRAKQTAAAAQAALHA